MGLPAHLCQGSAVMTPTNYSGIVVWSREEEFSACLLQLSACPGVEVHYSHAASGRIVVVQETDSVEAQESGLRHIQRLPAVRMAALVEHRIVR